MSMITSRVLSTLQLCMKGFDTKAYFYVPISDEPPKNLSGTVLTLFSGIPEPTTAISYFSHEDVQKVCKIDKINKIVKIGKIGKIDDFGKCMHYEHNL